MLKKTQAGHDDWIAVVENRIIEARHSYSPNAQKLLLIAISRIQEPATTTELPEIVVEVPEFQRYADISSNNTYQSLDRACHEIMRSPLSIKLNPNDRARKEFSWFDYADYDGNGQVKLKFAPAMAQFLIGLKGRFTQLRIERFFKLRSGYSMRFLERITQIDDLKRPGWTMTIDELRDWLGTTKESYPNFGMLRVRVLETAQRELDAKSDRSFDFIPLKNGREFRSVEFRVRPARRKNPPLPDKLLSKESPTVRKGITAKALAYAKTLPRWSADDGGWADGPITDEVILADPAFASILKKFIDEEKGQPNLDLQGV